MRFSGYDKGLVLAEYAKDKGAYFNGGVGYAAFYCCVYLPNFVLDYLP